jgi:hypothetical protein
MASFPPCVRDASRSESVRTVVAKVDAPNAAVMNWLSSATGAGRDAHAVAIVQLQKDLDTHVFYIVLTLFKGGLLSNLGKGLHQRLAAPPMSATVHWIRPFDRRLQRLFEWGDVWAEREVVEKAVDEEDKALLLQIFPALATAIKAGDIAQLPQLLEHSATAGLLQIEDAPSTKGLMRLQHECLGSHVFGQPNEDWECTVCNNMGAARCACGAQRCKLHQCIMAAPPRHRTIWKQSEFAPAPFYVQDPSWMRKELKVEWLRDELDDDATLAEFAEVYIRLFSEKIRPEAHRLACLELYRLFNPAFKPKKECELSPVALVEFQRVFDSAAPPRCLWCSKQLENGGEYCNLTCAEAANPPQNCQKCRGTEHKILHAPRGTQGGRFAAQNGMSRCKVCGHTEFCSVLAGYERPKRRVEPKHWSKRKRS